jgi:hypothetical protein
MTLANGQGTAIESVAMGDAALTAETSRIGSRHQASPLFSPPRPHFSEPHSGLVTADFTSTQESPSRYEARQIPSSSMPQCPRPRANAGFRSDK